MMFRANYVEKIGSGIKRIKKYMKDYNLKIDFNITSDWFKVIFHRKFIVLKESSPKGKGNILKKIKQLIVENNMKELDIFIISKLGENYQKVGRKQIKSWGKIK